MRKSLELKIYDRCHCGQGEPHYDTDEGLTVWWADDRAYERRLTDAELMAEHWRADGDEITGAHAYPDETTWPNNFEEQAETIKRFSTHDHA